MGKQISRTTLSLDCLYCSFYFVPVYATIVWDWYITTAVFSASLWTLFLVVNVVLVTACFVLESGPWVTNIVVYSMCLIMPIAMISASVFTLSSAKAGWFLNACHLRCLVVRYYRVRTVFAWNFSVFFNPIFESATAWEIILAAHRVSDMQ